MYVDVDSNEPQVVIGDDDDDDEQAHTYIHTYIHRLL